MFTDGALVATREHAKGDLAVRGPASPLLLWAYNRVPAGTDGLESFGDPALLDGWAVDRPLTARSERGGAEGPASAPEEGEPEARRHGHHADGQPAVQDRLGDVALGVGGDAGPHPVEQAAGERDVLGEDGEADRQHHQARAREHEQAEPGEADHAAGDDAAEAEQQVALRLLDGLLPATRLELGLDRRLPRTPRGGRGSGARACSPGTAGPRSSSAVTGRGRPGAPAAGRRAPRSAGGW